MATFSPLGSFQRDRAFSRFGKELVDHKVARFRQVNMDHPQTHHDAPEFPGGHIVMVTRLVAGQTATGGAEHFGGALLAIGASGHYFLVSTKKTAMR